MLTHIPFPEHFMTHKMFQLQPTAVSSNIDPRERLAEETGFDRPFGSVVMNSDLWPSLSEAENDGRLFFSKTQKCLLRRVYIAASTEEASGLPSGSTGG